MSRSHFRRTSTPSLDAQDLARLAKLEPSMQAQYRAQKAAKASSSLRSSDFAVPVSRTPTRARDKREREKRSKGDLLTHLMSMLSPGEEVKALNEIRMVVASEQQSARQPAGAGADFIHSFAHQIAGDRSNPTEQLAVKKEILPQRLGGIEPVAGNNVAERRELGRHAFRVR